MKKLLSISESSDINYLCKIVKIEAIRPHPNPEVIALQVVTIDGKNIITNMDTKVGDIKILFPIECAIATEYLSANNEYRDIELNKDKNAKGGFFEEKGRCKAIKLQKMLSEGYLAPVETLSFMLTEKEIESIKDSIGIEFDTINDFQLAKKYVIKIVNTPGSGKNKKEVNNSLKDLMIPNQFRFHAETTHLVKYISQFNPEDDIIVTYKLHGSSCILSNVLINKYLKWYEKFLKRINVNISQTEYGYIYSSGKPKSRLPKNILSAINNKNQYTNKNGDFYKTNIWKKAFDDHKSKLIKGLSIYGELVGWDGEKCIQPEYDYGIPKGEQEFFVYRINFTNPDGNVIEFNWNQIKEWCNNYGLKYVPELYVGKAKNLFPDLNVNEHWHQNFIDKLKTYEFMEKNCIMSKNKVPAEGMVVSKLHNTISDFIVYKIKAEKFVIRETKQLDAGVLDIETAESIAEFEN